MDNDISLTPDECKKYMAKVNGLYGPYVYSGKNGVYEYIERAGCIQFDPVDICGKNPELVLLSRVAGFKKDMLYGLLYEERRLIEYFDKQLSIMPAGDFRFFPRMRKIMRNTSYGSCDIDKATAAARDHIIQNGPVSSAGLHLPDPGLNKKVDWYWNETKLSRAALEAMYFRGELVISRRSGTNKYYDLIENRFPAHIYEDDYMADDDHFYEWWLLRRIKSAGILWNRPSDVFLGMDGFNASVRNKAFSGLLAKGLIKSISVDGLKDTFYIAADDTYKIPEIKEGRSPRKRCEFIAPLDNMLWDRKLIEAIFKFSYKWEVYTPKEKRKYSCYTLPVFYGYDFAGRAEAVRNKENSKLEIKNFWKEDGFKVSKAFKDAFMGAVYRLAALNGMEAADESGIDKYIQR